MSSRTAGTVAAAAFAALALGAGNPDASTASGGATAIGAPAGGSAVSDAVDAPAAPPADTVVSTPARGRMSYVAFGPRGRRVASSSLDGRVYLWDARTGQEIRRFSGLGKEAYAVDFSPDGGLLAAAGYGGTVRVWDLENGRVRHTLRSEPWALDLAFGPRGEELLVGEVDGDVVVHSLDGGEPDTLPGPRRHASAVAWSSDGGRRAAAFSGIYVHGDGAAADTLRGHGHAVLDLEFAAGGDVLVSGSSDASVRVWRRGEDAARDTLVTDMPAPFVSVSADGELLAAGGAGRTVRVWPMDDLGGEAPVVARHDKLITGVDFSPSGDRVASAGLDGRVRIAPVPAPGSTGS
jgi:WD40 repeat protein